MKRLLMKFAWRIARPSIDTSLDRAAAKLRKHSLLTGDEAARIVLTVKSELNEFEVDEGIRSKP